MNTKSIIQRQSRRVGKAVVCPACLGKQLPHYEIEKHAKVIGIEIDSVCHTCRDRGWVVVFEEKGLTA